MASAPADRPQPAVRGFFAVVRRRKWLILVAVIATTAASLVYSGRQEKLYSASAQVLLNPDASLLNGAGKTAADAQARFDAGQAVVARSPAIAAAALRIAGQPAGITPASLTRGTSVVSDPTSNLLTFRVTSREPKTARALVNAFASAYTRSSVDGVTRRIRAAIATLSQQITATQQRIQAAKAANQSAAALYAELHGQIDQRTKDQQALTTVKAGGPLQFSFAKYSPMRPSPASRTWPSA